MAEIDPGWDKEEDRTDGLSYLEIQPEQRAAIERIFQQLLPESTFGLDEMQERMGMQPAVPNPEESVVDPRVLHTPGAAVPSPKKSFVNPHNLHHAGPADHYTMESFIDPGVLHSPGLTYDTNGHSTPNSSEDAPHEPDGEVSMLPLVTESQQGAEDVPEQHGGCTKGREDGYKAGQEAT
ncbi:uncharacterized protein BCR38DRAFT_485613 [Pseudomassariella vexata]|uniref:Uncharacterized protein n=1 Tax=Pseudomassariella vexata TaxID=1141098 RepID=A0A1Y2DZD7_9PEZI|nr:uncharacterized protein BCR38DRAFT_485613 [Pseudomassariella vexata]ORY64466.1 hypothetical protein BCR38DRAFT_485613 [Pseudomassariella vexata]